MYMFSWRNNPLLPIEDNLLSRKMTVRFWYSFQKSNKNHIRINNSILAKAIQQIAFTKNIEEYKSQSPISYLQTLCSNTTTQAASVYKSPIITNTDLRQVCHNDSTHQLPKKTIKYGLPTTRQQLDPKTWNIWGNQGNLPVLGDTWIALPSPLNYMWHTGSHQHAIKSQHGCLLAGNEQPQQNHKV